MSRRQLAGKPVPASAFVDVPRLVAAYYTVAPDMATSGPDHPERIQTEAQAIIAGALADSH